MSCNLAAPPRGRRLGCSVSVWSPRCLGVAAGGSAMLSRTRCRCPSSAKASWTNWWACLFFSAACGPNALQTAEWECQWPRLGLGYCLLRGRRLRRAAGCCWRGQLEPAKCWTERALPLHQWKQQGCHRRSPCCCGLGATLTFKPRRSLDRQCATLTAGAVQ